VVRILEIQLFQVFGTDSEYERVVELATSALAILPADWVYEHFGMVAPASVYARSWLVISLAELGRFGEAAARAAEAIRLAEATQHAYTGDVSNLLICYPICQAKAYT
jgi:hypothetical protein